jgi:hypothetical protein
MATVNFTNVLFLLWFQLEKLIGKNYFLNQSAREAYKAYVRSYDSHSLKTIFDVETLDLPQVAKSFGFLAAPCVDLSKYHFPYFSSINFFILKLPPKIYSTTKIIVLPVAMFSACLFKLSSPKGKHLYSGARKAWELLCPLFCLIKLKRVIDEGCAGRLES